MEVMPGYKQTEVGVIPEEWEVSPFSGLFNITAGGDVDPKRSQSYRDAIHHHPIYSNALTNYGLYGYCSYADHPKGSITITARGMVGGANFRDHPYTAIGRVLVLQPKIDIAGIYFTEVINNRVKFANESTGVPQLTAPQISKYRLPVPPLPEQRAIAEALSDVDEMLGALDRLIAKKRDLKQAAMQQLLTGQTRLPGFYNVWLRLNMAENSTLKARIGWQGLTTAEYLDTGEYYLVTGTDFSGGRIAWSSCCYVAAQRYLQDRNIHLRPNDVLLTKDGTIGKVAFIDELPGPATLNSGVFVIRPKDGAYDPRYFFYVLTSRIFDEFLTRLQAGSTITHLYQKDFRNFSFLAPTMIAEQTAIAEMLTDMDEELTALEQRREKIFSLKQAMMQELLTGRIRLVPPAASSPEKSHNWAINEAVVVAVLVKHFADERFPLGRKRCTKLSYLLPRHVEHAAPGYPKKAAGPYNPAVKYRGPEKIAQENGYIRSHKNGNFAGYVAADKIAKAEGYFEKWYGSDALRWLEHFRLKTNDELELLTTIDMAMEDLRSHNRAVDLIAVKKVIQLHPEWKAKLTRPIFSDSDIERAITVCGKLFAS